MKEEIYVVNTQDSFLPISSKADGYCCHTAGWAGGADTDRDDLGVESQ